MDKKNYADMEPLEELYAIREEIMHKYKTIEAYGEYLQSVYPLNPPAKPQQPKQKGRRASTKAKANARPALRQRKTTVHT